jgi:hypothetical protein
MLAQDLTELQILAEAEAEGALPLVSSLLEVVVDLVLLLFNIQMHLRQLLHSLEHVIVLQQLLDPELIDSMVPVL